MADDLTPEAQIKKLAEENASLKAQLANAETRVRDLEPHKAIAERHAVSLEQLRAEVKTEREATSAKLAQYESEALEGVWKNAGIVEPDVRAMFQWQYNQLPAEGKPAFGDWMGGLAADPATATPVLRPFLASKTANTSTKPVVPSTPRDQRQALPNATNNVKATEPASAPFTAEQIRKMSPAEFMQQLPAIRASNPQIAKAFPELPGAGKAGA